MTSDIETSEFSKFVRRIMRAYGRRVGEGDEIEFQEMVDVRHDWDLAMAVAIERQLITYERSWAWIAAALNENRETVRITWLPRLTEEARTILQERSAGRYEAQARRRADPSKKSGGRAKKPAFPMSA